MPDTPFETGPADDPAAPPPEAAKVAATAKTSGSAAAAAEPLPPIKIPPAGWSGGAIIRKELITLLRAPRAFVFLVIVLGMLTGMVIIAWPPTTLVGVRAALSRNLFQTIATGEFVLLAFLAPVFSAGAITLEREKQSLDLLLTTPIRPSRILLEKFISAFVYLLLILIATAPVVSVTLFLGGVSIQDLILSYVLFAAAGALFTVVGLTCSTFFHRTFGALVATYLIVLPLGGGVLALYTSYTAEAATRGGGVPVSFVVAFVQYGALLSVIPLIAATVRLSRPPPAPPKSLEDENPDEQRILSLDRSRFPDKLLIPGRLGTFLEDWRNPVLEKEIRFEIFGKGSLLMRVIILVGFVASIPFLCTLLTPYERWYGIYLVLFALLVTPSFAANSITQERERETLDLLLATPLTARTIVTGKLLGTIRSPMVLIALLVPYYIFGLLAGQLTIAELVIDLLIVGTAVIQCAAIGLAASAICRSTLAAMVSSYVVLLGLYIGPVILYAFLEAFTRLSYETLGWTTITSPIAAIGNAHFVEAPPDGDAVRSYVLGDGAGLLWQVHLAQAWVVTTLSVVIVMAVVRRLANPRAS